MLTSITCIVPSGHPSEILVDLVLQSGLQIILDTRDGHEEVYVMYFPPFVLVRKIRTCVDFKL